MQPDQGSVQLVGAGPGAADLMTVRGMRAIQNAQAVLYDALISEDVLALAPTCCLRIQTGKRAGKASMSQDTINRLMLRLAQRGMRVVRLKGGDPSVFGRSGEEIAFLAGHGIDVDVVPGVTAASAAAAQFGFPLTHRGQARRIVYCTARVQDGQLADGWDAGADTQATLAVYMGRDSAGAVSANLIARGRDPHTPAVAVENAGRAEARLVEGTLATLPGRLAAQAFDGPVVLIIGEATAVRVAAQTRPVAPAQMALNSAL